MSRSRTTLCVLYLVLAAVALVATWRQNIAFATDSGAGFSGFAAFAPAMLANRASTSITVDIFMFVLAALVWMVLEARRLGMRGVWLYLLFGMMVAISVTFPLFLAVRERRLAALGASDTEPAATASDKLGLGLFGAATLAFVVWCTLR